MKRIGILLLTGMILLTGCGKKDTQESENEAGAQAASMTSSAQASVTLPVTVSPAESITLPPVTISSESPEQKKFIQLQMVSMETGYALASYNQVYKTTDGGMSWESVYSIQGDNYLSGVGPVMCAVDENTLYIVAYYNKRTNVLSSTDSGKTWTSVVITSELSWVKNDVGSYDMDFIDAKNGYLMIESTPGAGQMLKTVYKTTDAGVNWTMITGDQGGQDNIPGMVSTGIGGFPGGISFSDPEQGWTVCSSYGPYGMYIYRTEDGGGTWSMTDLPELPKEYSEYDEFDLSMSASAPSFYGSDSKQGKTIVLFWLVGQMEISKTEYLYRLTDKGIWVVEGECNRIVSNECFLDDLNGYALDEDGYLCKTEDGGLNWKAVGQ